MGSATSQAPLFDHYAALLVYFVRVERGIMCPVLQNLKGLFENFFIIRRNRENVNRFVKRSVGIEIGAEFHPDGLQVTHDLVFLKIFGAVKFHVLHKMRQAELIIILEHRSGFDYQAQFGAFFRFAVFPDIVNKAVFKGANPDLRVNGNFVIQVIEYSGILGKKHCNGKQGREGEKE